MIARAPLTLPPYTPTDWELRLPGYPVIGNRWRSTSLPDALGSIPSGAEWRLTYENRTSDETLALLLPWRATGGGQWPLTPLPPETAYGVNNADFLRRLMGTTWTIAREPQKQAVKKGRFNVTIELIYELTFESNYRIPVASARGFALSVVASFAGGAAQGNLNASATGFNLSIATSLAGGVAQGNAGASATGFDLSIAASFEGGVATGAATDPSFSSVGLLLHMDGSNGSTTFTDTSTTAHTISVFGDAQVTTTLPRFGTGALLLDGTGDYLSAPSHSSLTFGTGDFTIEAWVRFGTVSTRQYIFSQRDTGGFTLYLLADGRLSGLAPGLNAVTQTSATIAVDTWHHVAFTRSGTSYNVWVDGVGSSTATFSGLDGASGTSYIGYRGSGTIELLDGRIDDLRITKGVARYTANFTPPTEAFPGS